MTELDARLTEGIAALKAGRKKEARDLLLQVLQRDGRNEQAWLWLSEVFETHKLRQTCLMKVLDINPENEQALSGLRQLGAVSRQEESPSGRKDNDATTAPREELWDEQGRWSSAGTYLAFTDIPESSLGWTKPGLSRTEARLARTVWDTNCDRILRRLVEDYAWDAYWHVLDRITNYLSPKDLEAFQRRCTDAGIAIKWSTLLQYYGKRRLAELGLKSREPRVISCAACGFKFREWLIHGRWLERVGGNVRFCPACYGKVLDPRQRLNDAPRSVTRTEMLRRLEQLASAMECVPLVSFLRFPSFEEVSEEKQVAICKAILAMPPYWVYVDRFGSWLAALTEAGILQDGILPTPLGTRCLAEDGHECFSLAEKSVDDWLTLHGIEHEKEPYYPHDDVLNTTGMRADWKVGDTLIEYAGLLDNPEYAARIETKRELAAKLNLNLIVLEGEDLLTLADKLGCLVAQ